MFNYLFNLFEKNVVMVAMISFFISILNLIINIRSLKLQGKYFIFLSRPRLSVCITDKSTKEQGRNVFLTLKNNGNSNAKILSINPNFDISLLTYNEKYYKTQIDFSKLKNTTLYPANSIEWKINTSQIDELENTFVTFNVKYSTTEKFLFLWYKKYSDNFSMDLSLYLQNNLF